MADHTCFTNRDCAFFPCHRDADPENFNCLFCYCPLYILPDCGGNYTILKNGIKDCSACLLPHRPENYPQVISRFRELSAAEQRLRAEWEVSVPDKEEQRTGR